MLASPLATGGFVAIATLFAGAVANVDAGATVNPLVTQYHAASAQIVGTAETTFFVQRFVLAQANILCTADVLAFPEGRFGKADIDANANVTAIGTRVQPGRASGTATAEVVPNPYVLRMARADVLGTATVRPEAQRNKQVDGFAYLTATADFALPDAGIVRRMARATLDIESTCTPVATRTQGGAAVISAFGDMIAEIDLYKTARVEGFSAAAEFVANAVRYALPSVDVQGTADIAPRPVQRHAAHANVDASAAVAPLATREARTTAAPFGTADVTATGTRQRMADATADGAANVIAVAQVNIATVGQSLVGTAVIDARPVVLKMAVADVLATADVNVDAVRQKMASVRDGGTCEVVAVPLLTASADADVLATGDMSALAHIRAPGVASISATADMSAIPSTYSALRFAECAISTSSVVVADAMAFRAGVAAFGGSCSVDPEAFTNPAAIDPPERTMVRQFVDREMSRPFVDREMRRAA
jgi:hypothetical protein